MAFYVGQKVVCIAERMPRHGEIMPRLGQVYTIREFDRSHPAGDLYLRFEEVRNHPRQYITGFLEASFCSDDFRPIVERKTSIEIFQRMLNPSKTEVSA